MAVTNLNHLTGHDHRHGLDLNDDASFPVGDAVLDLLPPVLGQWPDPRSGSTRYESRAG